MSRRPPARNGLPTVEGWSVVHDVSRTRPSPVTCDSRMKRFRKFKLAVIPALGALALAPIQAVAASISPDYRIVAETFDAGGGPAQSTSYRILHCAESGFTGTRTQTGGLGLVVHGFIPQTKGTATVVGRRVFYNLSFLGRRATRRRRAGMTPRSRRTRPRSCPAARQASPTTRAIVGG